MGPTILLFPCTVCGTRAGWNIQYEAAILSRLTWFEARWMNGGDPNERH